MSVVAEPTDMNMWQVVAVAALQKHPVNVMFPVLGHALLRNLHNRQFSHQCVEDGSQLMSVTRSIVDLESNTENAATTLLPCSLCWKVDKCTRFTVEALIRVIVLRTLLSSGRWILCCMVERLYMYIAQIELFDEMSQMVQVNFMLEKDEVHF